jgi:hypothetical protein
MATNEKKRKVSQVLPAVRRLPRVKITPALVEQIDQIVSRAEKRNRKDHGDEERKIFSAVSAALAVARVESAISFFVSEKENEVTLPDFREMLTVNNRASVAWAINNLLESFFHSLDCWLHIGPTS